MMREGGVVNINLLTHLEYYRVRYLVKHDNMRMDEAKEKAKNEILTAFGIKGDFASSEDLDIFSTGDGNAALLAISVLMQHDFEEVADLTELLTAFASDIEEDGKWDEAESAKYKAEIADWASAQDISGGLAKIRTNIEKWNLGKVPEFEKYVRNFWYINYGLGECTKNKYGNVLAINNELSANSGKKIRFICKDGAWVEASDIEKDTYQWADGHDGDVKYGSVNKEACYVYEGESWIPADGKSCLLELRGCTEQWQGHVERVNANDYYTCDNKSWREANDLEKDTYQWPAGTDGEIKKGNLNPKNYKYDELQGKWLPASTNDASLGLQGCTKKRSGEITQCAQNEEYYVCKDMDWFVATEVDYDTQGHVCDDDNIGAVTLGKGMTNKYYCTTRGWILVPSGWSWDVPKEARFNSSITYGNLTDDRDGKTYKTVNIGTQTWLAENMNYEVANSSWCYKKDPQCNVSGRYYNWAAAKVACPKGWHLPTMDEWATLTKFVYGSDCVTEDYCEEGGALLMSQTGWEDDGYYHKVDATDEYGFSVLPTGIRESSGVFSFDDGSGHNGFYYAYLWSATEEDGYVNGAAISFYGYIYSANLDKTCGYPVRCVKNNNAQ